VGCGSYLRKDGKVVLQSLSKVYTVFTCRDRKMEVALQGQPLMRAYLRTLEEPLAVRLNERPVDFVYDTKQQMLRLQLHDTTSTPWNHAGRLDSPAFFEKASFDATME
jgi:hypothetical protein